MEVREKIRWLLQVTGQGAIWLLAGLATAIIVMPVAALLWRSCNRQAWRVASDATQDAIYLSFTTTAYSLLIILIVGTPLAYVLARWRFPGRRLLSVVIELPIVLPPAVAGLALLSLFGRRQGLLGPTLMDIGIRLAFTRYAVIIAQTFVAMPFYIRAAQIGFQNVEREIEDAALVDGATTWGRFRHVTLPLSSRALINGALLAWARALGEFGATILFAGSLRGRTQTMPLLIYNVFEQNIDAAIWTAIILVALAVAVLALTRLLTREDRRDWQQR